MRYLAILGVAAMALGAVTFAEPAAEGSLQGIAEAIRKECPGAVIEVSKEGIVAKQGTMMYTLHSIAKTGEVSEKTYQAEGPNHKGFILRVFLREGAYGGAAATPQILREPYYATFIDAVPTEGGKKHFSISFSYGGQLDPKVKQALFESLPMMVAKRGGERDVRQASTAPGKVEAEAGEAGKQATSQTAMSQPAFRSHVVSRYAPEPLERGKLDRIRSGMTLGEIVEELGPGWVHPWSGTGMMTWVFDDGRRLRVWPRRYEAGEVLLETENGKEGRMWVVGGVTEKTESGGPAMEGKR